MMNPDISASAPPSPAGTAMGTQGPAAAPVRGPSHLHDAITDNYLAITERGACFSDAAVSACDLKYGRWLTDWLPTSASASALDLGCGTGPMIYLLASRGIGRIVGVDLCKPELEVAKGIVASAELHYADVLSFLKEASAESFDFICAMNILEHLPNDGLFSTLKEVRRMLKPDGALVAMVPNAQSPFGGMTRYWDMTHQNAFTPASVRQLVCAAGFGPTDVSYRECGPRPHGLKSTVRWILWKGDSSGNYRVETALTKEGIYTSDMLFCVRKRAG